MRLVKIDGKYINTDRVNGLFGITTGETNIFVGGSKRPFVVEKNIDEVAAIIEAAKLENEKA